MLSNTFSWEELIEGTNVTFYQEGKKDVSVIGWNIGGKVGNYLVIKENLRAPFKEIRVFEYHQFKTSIAEGLKTWRNLI